VELSESSRGGLLATFGHLIPEGWTTKAEHMTICLGPLDKWANSQAGRPTPLVGATVELLAVATGRDDSALAIGVVGCLSNNKNPHITIAVAPGHRPVESNFIAA
jgi:hypothetical protein